MFELRRCRRSDRAHFDFYCGLSQDVGLAIRESRKRHLPADDVDLHICISHKRRKLISHDKQVQFSKGKKSIVIPEGEDPKFKLCVGTPLIGSITNSEFTNGARYMVLSIGEKIRLQDIWTKREFEASVDAIRKQTQLAWAVVYQKVQGCTEEGTVILHDLSSRYLKRSHLYVGLSRVTDGNNVFIARD